MKLQARVDEASHEVELSGAGPDLTLRVDDKEYRARVIKRRPGVMVVVVDGHPHTILVNVEGDEAIINIGSHRIQVDIKDPRNLRRAEGAALLRSGMVRSNMAGKVKEVLVTAGQAVAEGDTIMVIEAMKMLLPVKAPFAGTVTNLPIRAEDTVKNKDLLVEITAETE